MAEARQPVGWVVQLWREASADRPSAIELLLGPERGLVVFRWVAAWWGTVVAAIVAVCLLLVDPDQQGMHRDAALAGAVLAAVVGIVVALGRRASRRFLTGLVVGSIPFMTAELWLMGPRLEMGVVVLGLAALQCLLYLRPRAVVVAHVLLYAGYAAVLFLDDGYADPGVHLVVLIGVVTVTSIVLSWVVGLIEDLALAAREARGQLARANAELADVNAQLERQLDRQGEEIGSLRRLRQFLSPQVAEAVLQEGIEALAPHRCRIAVIFCDLRGFTTFSTTAEPEEVMEVLDRYYVTVGRALQEEGATVGSFAGDGIMAYFGDPVPCDDAAGTAVRMAVDLSRQMGDVVSGWRRRGFDVGCGMGIAYGYATIGPVGFDERTDYTALGPTVNLASRFGDMAADGEILIDGRAHEAVDGRVACDERIVEVRGFRLPVHAYNVTAWLG